MKATRIRHPKALPYLFLTEMWERFGFYVLQGLLILYMTQYFGYTDSEGYSILGVFSALVYISPFVGGFIADRLLGFKTAIVWGGLFLILGYALLALPYAHLLFYPALAVIIVGNGLFKPNISSLLGMQYTQDDPRRDSAFTIFYIGINIGVFLSGFSSGYIKDHFGWRMSFALGGIGLAIGLVTFFLGKRYIKDTAHQFDITTRTKLQLLFYCLLAILGLNFLLQINVLANWLLPIVGITLLIFLVILTLQQNAEYRKRLFMLNMLIISSVVFWSLFLQMFFAANLFIERLVSKTFVGIPLTTTIFYASESVFIILLGPLFAYIWEALARRNTNPSPIIKFVYGIALLGVGFFILSLSTYFPGSSTMIAAGWVFGAYLFITMGELFVSPIGLSAVTSLAPSRLVGMMMGIWFVATGFGGIFAGMLANYFASIPDDVQDPLLKLAIYHGAFLNYAYLAFFVAIVLFFIQLTFKKWLRITIE